MKHSSLASLTLLPLALVLSACATSGDSSQVASADEPERVVSVAAAQPRTVDYDPNEQVCKRQAVIGSNFKKKVCMTRAQWDEMTEKARKETGDIQRRGGSPGRSN